MDRKSIMARTPLVLTNQQRETYFDQGFLSLPGFTPEEWLEKLVDATAAMVERSRSMTRSDEVFDLERDHSSDRPRLQRISQPAEQHPAFWEFASDSLIVDIAEDLLGPNVRYHHSKLNYKSDSGGAAVKWHQDIPFVPHTNYNVLTIGVYLSDVDDTMAPLAIVPRSHDGELFNLYNDKEQWAGTIADRDIERAGIERAQVLTGPIGTITVHSCRALHGSIVNTSPRSRPLLLCMYGAADAIPLTSSMMTGEKNGTIVRGRTSHWAEFDPRPCPMPPGDGRVDIFKRKELVA